MATKPFSSSLQLPVTRKSNLAAAAAATTGRPGTPRGLHSRRGAFSLRTLFWRLLGLALVTLVVGVFLGGHWEFVACQVGGLGKMRSGPCGGGGGGDEGEARQEEQKSEEGDAREEGLERTLSPAAKFLYYRQRPDGFNNQLQTVVAGVMLARKLGLTYVLPHFFEDFQVGRRVASRHYPFSDYLDAELLSQLVPVAPFEAFMQECVKGPRPSRLMELRLPTRSPKFPRITRFEQALSLKVRGSVTLESVEEMQAFVHGREAHGRRCFAFLDYKAFQKDLDALTMVFHRYRGWDVLGNATFRLVRSHLRPAPQYWAVARQLVAAWDQRALSLGAPPGGLPRTLSIHVRRGDYLYSGQCTKWSNLVTERPKSCPNEEDVCACTAAALTAAPSVRVLVVFTTLEGVEEYRSRLNACLAERFGHTKLLGTSVPEALAELGVIVTRDNNALPADFNTSSTPLANSTPAAAPLPEPIASHLRDGRVDVLGVLEQTVGALTGSFIGNMVSTWSCTIFQERELAGLPILVWRNCSIAPTPPPGEPLSGSIAVQNAFPLYSKG